jgi:hypothetical protein
MTFTSLNPITKSAIRISIESVLYSPFHRQQQKEIEKLIIQNCRAQRTPHLSFLYKNELYSMDPGAPPLRKTRLLPQFRGVMDELLAEQRRLEEEKPFVIGFITAVLNASNAPGDWLKIFPESMHFPMKKKMEDIKLHLDWSQTQLPEDIIAKLPAQYAELIQIVKQRMTMNILIS